MSRPPFAPLVAGLPATVPFVGPEQQERERGRPFAARLGANESGFGPSPRAVAAMQAAAAGMWRYCDPQSADLKAALAAHHGIDPAAILVGEGIDGLLGLTVRLFVAPGDAVVTSAGAYPTFNYHVAGYGGRLVTRPYRADREDVTALAEAARSSGARLVYLANPDNPMGSWHGQEAIAALLDALPEGCLLCLDEAYVELAPEGTAPDWNIEDTRLIRFRTFSKAQGLAGLRIGYAVGHPELIAGYDRIRNHFGVNAMAQAAALAALEDPGHLAAVRAAVADCRLRIGAIAAANGLAALPSATNFVAIDCGHDGAFARAVLAGLLARDIFVRMPGVAPLDRCIRVSCAPEREIDLFQAALPGALEAARATVCTGGSLADCD
ncbi:pyridoxal phosphate-dependent aminotransferase [Paralimibaculum aggregatum]|uniref:Pyridoxal phosphate-dependent aminotransferase n=1 Tax=Paralimibaculum aggregatum TaxID=3036245 RepID=A0ABQ6LKT7_9RHOB|nr:pyridoxal phosphate-dependent aminotransferase [Limibaculum sp. NKW23]GMG81269.1 pyridoxal phosphate-dependent aminotransferase [Limibaculum sp. NKW23]